MSTHLPDPTNSKRRLLVQIVLGSAWVDSRLDPGEITYLNRLLEREGLSHDAYLKSLLETPVSVPQTEVWMAQYLLQSNEEERQELLGSIGNVLMADDQIASSEHFLLDDYYALMERIPAQPDLSPQHLASQLVSGVSGLFKKVTRALKG